MNEPPSGAGRMARRQFLGTATANASAGLLAATSSEAVGSPQNIKAIAFDGFAIFDPRPVFKLAERLLPGTGLDLTKLWRTSQFECTWLGNSLGRYVDFWHVTQDALRYAAAQTYVSLTPAQSLQLMSAYLELKPWPDVAPVLAASALQQVHIARGEPAGQAVSGKTACAAWETIHPLSLGTSRISG